MISRSLIGKIDMPGREYFDLDVEDATVAYYAKQGFFHPTNSHDLRIQLETALEMLELVTCQKSIATHGLHYIVNPKMWRCYSTRIHDRFLTDKTFGSQFLYSVDLSLQTFFRQNVARRELQRLPGGPGARTNGQTPERVHAGHPTPDGPHVPSSPKRPTGVEEG